nr:hypothetical protein BaRGS_019720 [Batillaria attramentaria]
MRDPRKVKGGGRQVEIAVGSVIPFLAVYLKHLGLTAPETGLITGLSVFVAFLVRPILGFLADWLRARRVILVLCCLLFGLAFCSLWFLSPRDYTSAKRWHVCERLQQNETCLVVHNTPRDQLVCYGTSGSALWQGKSEVFVLKMDSHAYPESVKSSASIVTQSSGVAQRKNEETLDRLSNEDAVRSASHEEGKIRDHAGEASQGSSTNSPRTDEGGRVQQSRTDEGGRVKQYARAQEENAQSPHSWAVLKGLSKDRIPEVSVDITFQSDNEFTLVLLDRGITSDEVKMLDFHSVTCFLTSEMLFSEDRLNVVKQNTSGSWNTGADVSLYGRVSSLAPDDASSAEELDTSSDENIHSTPTFEHTTKLEPRKASTVYGELQCHYQCRQVTTGTVPAYNLDLVFFLTLTLIAVARAFYSSSTSLADTVTYTLLGSNRHQWGRQRLFGTVGTAAAAIVFTTVNDQLQEKGQEFSALFVAAFCFTLMACGTGFFLKVTSPATTTDTKRPKILRNVGIVLRKASVRVFLLKILVMGMFCGSAQNFIFWFLRDLGSSQTTLGVCLLANCASSVVVLRFAAYVIRRLGEARTMYLALPAYVLRFVLVSLIHNPWLAVPMEFLHGVTYSLLWAAASASTHLLAPAGTQATCQAIAGAIYWDMEHGLCHTDKRHNGSNNQLVSSQQR